MSADLEQLEARLAELKGERSAVESTMTREDLVRSVDAGLEAARAQAEGSSTFVLQGHVAGEYLFRVLVEDLLADEGLAGRVTTRLEARGFGELSDRAKRQRLGKLDDEIGVVEKDLLGARKAAALAEIEAEFAGAA